MKKLAMKIYKNSVVQIVALTTATTILFGAMGAMVFFSAFPPMTAEQARIEKISDQQDKLRAEAIKEMQREEMKDLPVINCKGE